MLKTSRILCVIDPAAPFHPAMHRAAWLAKKMDAKLELLVCLYDDYVSNSAFFDARSMQRMRDEWNKVQETALEVLAEPLRTQGVEIETTAVCDHPLHEGIVRHAIASGADIVLKDTHHHLKLSLSAFSNSDWNLIRTCPMPLWFVKPHEIPEELHLIAAIDPLNEHDKPAALDDEIVLVSKTIAEDIGADVHIFHAFDPRIAIASMTANAYVPVSMPLDEIEEQVRQQHQGRFKEFVDFHGIPDDRAHLIAGLTHEELPELATKMDAVLVIMGAIARNRWKRIFIGATAEQTLDRLPCDLLVIKPDWFQTPVDPKSHHAT